MTDKLRIMLAAAMVAVSIPAMAAEITPTYTDFGNRGEIKWEQINADDAAAEATITLEGGKRGALYRLLVEGADNNVDFTMKAGRTSAALVDVDPDQMPDGVRFSSAADANMALVCLTQGDKVDLIFNSAGAGGQDIDVYLTPLGDCH